MSATRVQCFAHGLPVASRSIVGLEAIEGVLSDVNLHFIVQTYHLARMKLLTKQNI